MAKWKYEIEYLLSGEILDEEEAHFDTKDEAESYVGREAEIICGENGLDFSECHFEVSQIEREVDLDDDFEL